tara:strand:- start:41 stop:484 length:444 start_codon:yes stop_codon:yes gene_type:complete
MKKLLLLLLFIPLLGFSQIGEVKSIDDPEEILVGYNNKMTKFHKLSYSLNSDNKKLYTISYRNMKYQQIDEYGSFSFTAADEEIEYLYNFFLEQMSDKSGKTIELGENKIFARKVGKAVQISDMTPGVIDNNFWLLKKDLERFFGKR